MAEAPSGADSTTRGRVVAGIIAAAVVSVVAYFMFSTRSSSPRGEDPHRAALDKSGDAYAAMMSAPEGATPCETSYNALDAFQRKVDELHLPPRFASFPDRAAFVAVCTRLSDAEQKCLLPKYQMKNQQQCEPVLRRVWSPAIDGGPPSLAEIMPPFGGAVGPAYSPQAPSAQ